MGAAGARALVPALGSKVPGHLISAFHFPIFPEHVANNHVLFFKYFHKTIPGSPHEETTPDFISPVAADDPSPPAPPPSPAPSSLQETSGSLGLCVPPLGLQTCTLFGLPWEGAPVPQSERMPFSAA